MGISIARIIQSAGIVAFASTGLMQAAQQATFHLPVAAHWGSVLLKPGDYHVSLPEISQGERAFRVTGNGKSMFELALTTDVRNASKHSQLELLPVNGNYFVREFSYGPIGRTFTFAVPKASRREEVALLISNRPANTGK